MCVHIKAYHASEPVIENEVDAHATTCTRKALLKPNPLLHTVREGVDTEDEGLVLTARPEDDLLRCSI